MRSSPRTQPHGAGQGLGGRRLPPTEPHRLPPAAPTSCPHSRRLPGPMGGLQGAVGRGGGLTHHLCERPPRARPPPLATFRGGRRPQPRGLTGSPDILSPRPDCPRSCGRRASRGGLGSPPVHPEHAQNATSPGANEDGAAAGVVQWLERWPMASRVPDSIPGRGTPRRQTPPQPRP